MNKQMNSFIMRACLTALPLLAAVVTAGVAMDASAASDCQVTSTVDDGDPGSLRWCVDAINNGSYDTVVFTTSGVHELKYPLVLARPMTWEGNGATISPLSSFSDPSLVEVHGDTVWDAADLILDADGQADVRSIHVASAGAKAFLDNVDVVGFQIYGDGGGIWVETGKLDFANGDITDCAADNGGAVAVEGGELELYDSFVYNNRATSSGGGLYASSVAQSLKIERTQVLENDAEFGGGVRSSVGATVLDSSIDSNDADSGGGFYGSGVMIRSAFVGNTASMGAGDGNPGGGGGLYVTGKTTLRACYVAGNVAEAGGGLKAQTGEEVRIEESTIFENITLGQQTASALSITGAYAIITNTTLARNSSLSPAAQGGTTLMAWGADIELNHVTMANNTSTSALKGFYADWASVVRVNSTMFANIQNPMPWVYECAINTNNYQEQTSLAHGRGCPNIPRSASYPVDPCQNTSDHNAACEPLLGQGLSTCHAAIDQRGAPRPGNACTIGALEAQ